MNNKIILYMVLFNVFVAGVLYHELQDIAFAVIAFVGLTIVDIIALKFIFTKSDANSTEKLDNHADKSGDKNERRH